MMTAGLRVLRRSLRFRMRVGPLIFANGYPLRDLAILQEALADQDCFCAVVVFDACDVRGEAGVLLCNDLTSLVF